MAGRSPPSSPRRSGEENEECTAIDDWVLASIEGWIRNCGRPQDDVVDKIMTSFDMEELRKAATRLRDGKWSAQFRVPDRGPADYSRQLATVVYRALLSIQDQDQPKVQFWVCAAELHKVPGAAFVDDLDEAGVSARLNGVDGKLEAMMERLKGAERLEESVKDLNRVVTSLQDQLKSRIVEQVPAGMSYADRTRVNRSLVRTSQEAGRGRSQSLKRTRDQTDDVENQLAKQRRQNLENEVQLAQVRRQAHAQVQGSELSQDLRALKQFGWQEPRRKRQGGIRKGSSAVQAEGGIAAPVSVFISRTSPNCTEDTVKEKLEQCATAMAATDDESGSKLKVLKVEQIRIQIPDGEERRSRCWKVTVSPECAEHMSKDEAYPAAWGWRKWNRGPRSLEQGSKTLELRPSQGHGGSQVLNVGA